MRNMTRAAAMACALMGTAASAADVAFRLGLAGPARDRVVAIIDLSAAPSNAIVRYATIDATITDVGGKRYSFTRDLLAGNVVVRGGTKRTVAFEHKIRNARGIESRGLSWSTEAGGGKADGMNRAPATIDDMSAVVGVIVAPPLAAVISCEDYGDSAVKQQATNLARVCGYVSTRWSKDKACHVRWCRTAPAGSAATEMRARNKLLMDCARR